MGLANGHIDQTQNTNFLHKHTQHNRELPWTPQLPPPPFLCHADASHLKPPVPPLQTDSPTASLPLGTREAAWRQPAGGGGCPSAPPAARSPQASQALTHPPPGAFSPASGRLPISPPPSLSAGGCRAARAPAPQHLRALRRLSCCCPRLRGGRAVGKGGDLAFKQVSPPPFPRSLFAQKKNPACVGAGSGRRRVF